MLRLISTPELGCDSRLVAGIGTTNNGPPRTLIESSCELLPLVEHGGITIPPGLVIEDHEYATATRLAAVGLSVFFRPLGDEGKNPDVIIKELQWEMKSPEGASEKNTLDRQFSRAHNQQARNVIIDLARTNLNPAITLDRMRRRLAGTPKFDRFMLIDRSGKVTLLEIAGIVGA